MMAEPTTIGPPASVAVGAAEFCCPSGSPPPPQPASSSAATVAPTAASFLTLNMVFPNRVGRKFGPTLGRSQRVCSVRPAAWAGPTGGQPGDHTQQQVERDGQQRDKQGAGEHLWVVGAPLPGDQQPAQPAAADERSDGGGFHHLQASAAP